MTQRPEGKLTWSLPIETEATETFPTAWESSDVSKPGIGWTTAYRTIPDYNRRVWRLDLDKQLLGQRLGPYRLFARLGCGNMGAVYLVWHEALHRLSALKIIPPAILRQHPQRLEMFLTEARAAARLNHPNIVTIYSLGRERHFHFIEMEFIQGPTLRQYLQEHAPLSILTATHFAAQMAAGLAAAHASGVIHGDLKPENVLVHLGGRAKLNDFGLARLAYRELNTDQHQIAGTAGYMAPELFEGQPPDTASDLYALGVTWFSLLTNQLPHTAADVFGLWRRVVQFGPVDVREHRPEVPAHVVDLLNRLMQVKSADRPQNTQAVADELRQLTHRLITTSELITQAVAGTSIRWTQVAPDHFQLHVQLGLERQQTVIAEVVAAGAQSPTLLTFWTPCAPADTELYAAMLKLNARLAFGSISLREFQGKPYFVMVERFPRDNVSAATIRETILHLARAADTLELQLTGADIH